MQDVPRRLSRPEIDRLLRMVRGSKTILADRANVQGVYLSQWLRKDDFLCPEIEAVAHDFALSIAASLGLSHDEIYLTGPCPVRRTKRGVLVKKPPMCRTLRPSLLASA